MSRFQPVAQKDEWGCGIACVASLLSISYEEAYWCLRNQKGESISGGNPGLELHHIALALQAYGFKVVADWEEAPEYPVRTILFVEGPEPYDGGHYILRVTKGWMDPWRNINRPSEKRKAGVIKNYPAGTVFSVALVPKAG